jgi:hypothetical protein
MLKQWGLAALYARALRAPVFLIIYTQNRALYTVQWTPPVHRSSAASHLIC